MLTSLRTVTAFYPLGQWQNSGAVKLTWFEVLGFYMVVILCASSLTDVNKCVIKLSQCDTEVLPLNSWKSEGMFTLRSGAHSRVPEATGDPGLESPYGAVQCRLTSLVRRHFSHSPADLCWRKEPCWAFITSGAVPQECCYPASGHWLASSRSVSLAHPLPFCWWGNAGRVSQAPWLPHPNLEGLVKRWEVSPGPLSPCPIDYWQKCPSLVISLLCIHLFCKQYV